MKIPDHAKRVFHGIIFDVYHWEQTLPGGSTMTFEGVKRKNTVQVIATRNGKVLIAQEEQPMFGKFRGLFGGRQEPGEEPRSTAERELREETGLVSQDWELFTVYEEPVGVIEWKIYLFVARNCKQVSKPEPEMGEKIDVIELDFDAFLNTLDSPDFRGTTVMTDDLHRLKLDQGEREAFRKKLFP